MFVSAGKKVVSFPVAVVARDGVGEDHYVEMAKMRQTVGVEDGSGDVEGSHGLGLSLFRVIRGSF